MVIKRTWQVAAVDMCSELVHIYCHLMTDRVTAGKWFIQLLLHLRP